MILKKSAGIKVGVWLLAVFLVMTLSSFVATAKEKITFVQFGPTPERRAGIEKAVARFEELYPDIEVVIRNEPWSAGSSILTAAITGNAPDGVINIGGWMGSWAASGVLEPLDEYIAKWDDADQIWDVYWPSSNYFGKQWGLPAYYNTMVMFWNKDHFQDIGLDPEKAPTDYVQFREYAIKLTRDVNGDGINDHWGFGPAGKRWDIPTFFWMMWDKEADYVKNVNGKLQPGFLSEKVYEGMEWYVNLYRKDHVIPDSAISQDFTDIRTAFVGGKLSMTMYYNFNVPYFNSIEDFNYGYGAMFKGKERAYTWAGPYHVIMFKASKHKEAAWEFMKFMSAGEGADIMSEATFFLPFDKRLLDARKDRPELQPFFESMPFSYPQPMGPEVGNSDTAWPPYYQQALLGQISAKEAVQGVGKEIQKQIDKIYANR